MIKHRLLSIILSVTVLLVALPGVGCSDKQTRQAIRDSVIGTQTVVKAVRSQLPPDDPRIAKLEKFSEALERFEKAFPDAKTDAEKENVVRLFADVVTAFSAGVLPLVSLGSSIAITIVILDSTLRFIATRLNRALGQYIKTLPEGSQKMEAKRYEKLFVDFIASPMLIPKPEVNTE